jgi:hypothetical protein
MAARGLWVQVDVDMPTDEKLFDRPESWRHLWTCLLCQSKKNVFERGDPTIHMDAKALSKRFNITNARDVENALIYFESCPLGAMVRRGADGSIFLLNFEKRQGGTYDPIVQRKKWRGIKERQRGKSTGQQQDGRDHLSTGHSRGQSNGFPALEVEQDQETSSDQQRRSQASQTGGQPPLPSDLQQGFHKNLALELCTRVSASPKIWADFMAKALVHSPRRREAAAREFLRRRCPEEGKGPGYLLSLIEEGAGNPGPEPVQVDPRPPWERAGYASHEEYEAAAAARAEEGLHERA